MGSTWWANSTCCSILEEKRWNYFSQIFGFLSHIWLLSLDGELPGRWRNRRVKIIHKRLRKYQPIIRSHSNRQLSEWNQLNPRIDAICTYSSAITLVLYFGVSVLKMAKYETVFKPELTSTLLPPLGTGKVMGPCWKRYLQWIWHVTGVDVKYWHTSLGVLQAPTFHLPI